MKLFPAEQLILGVNFALMALDLALIYRSGVGIDYPGYAAGLVIAGFCIGVGQLYRSYRSDEGIALATTACGLYIMFTIVASMCNYLLLPNHNTIIDPKLIKIDAALGFSWSSFVVWTAQWPWLGTLLRIVYMSSLAQLILVILILGFTAKRNDLHKFLLTGVFAAIMTIGTWSLFPSAGASAFETLAPQADGALPILVGPEYGAELLRLFADGVKYISPKNVLGVIGFPSFHCVMACLSLWYMFRFKYVFPLFFAVNIVMIPAIIVQGGHHLSDVLGGFAVFVLATFCAGFVLKNINKPYWLSKTSAITN